MPMTRADAIAYLADRLGVLLADAGMTPDTSGLGGVVDDALLLMGTAFADVATATVADASVMGYRAVLLYTALLHAYDAVINRVQTSKSLASPSVSKSESRQQIVDNLAKRLEAAKTTASAYIAIPEDNSWQAPGRLGLDTFNKPYLGDFGTIVNGPGWE